MRLYRYNTERTVEIRYWTYTTLIGDRIRVCAETDWSKGYKIVEAIFLPLATEEEIPSLM